MRTTVRRSPTVSRIVAVALAVVAAAVGSAGCGSSSSSLDPVARAASVSNAAAGYKLAMHMTMNGAGLPKPLQIAASGSFTPPKRQGQLTLSFDASAIPGAGQAFGGSSAEFQELMDGTTFYMKFPQALASRLPGGKPWIKFDIVALGKKGGIPGLGSLLNNPASGNPAELLQYLRASSGGVTKVGTATIAGIPTTEYKGTIDLDKYPTLLPSSQQAAARQAISALESLAKIKSFPVEVWIDGEHLVRQFAMTFSEALPNTGQSFTMQMTAQISDYGPQPAPSFPPADQVLDASSLLGAATP